MAGEWGSPTESTPAIEVKDDEVILVVHATYRLDKLQDALRMAKDLKETAAKGLSPGYNSPNSERAAKHVISEVHLPPKVNKIAV